MAEVIEENNNKTYIDFIKRFWDLDEPSMNFLKERIVSKDFDGEFFKLLKDSPDQRIRWDVDFSEPIMQEYYSSKDKAYEIFVRKFSKIISFLNNKYSLVIGYKEFMDNKIVFRKNETKLKKIFEIVYLENPIIFNKEFNRETEIEVLPEIVSDYIVKAFENIGTYKKPTKKVQIVLSLNLVDWLLASTGGNITSCLNMEGSGHKFWAGLAMISGDPNRAMLYITDGSKKNYEGMVVDNCLTRSWVILTKNNKKAIIRWYPNEIIQVEGIRTITKDNSFKSGMDSPGKNPIKPLLLSSGITSNIFMDEGSWEKNGENFIHVREGKGGFQTFTETLDVARSFEYKKPWDNSSSTEWRISDFKRLGLSINDYVPAALCSSCGKKKNYVKNVLVQTPVCHSCFNKLYFSCEICGSMDQVNKDHFEGLVFEGSSKKNMKVCNKCKNSMKKCECCGSFLINGLETIEGTNVCIFCANDQANNYRTCSVCKKISKINITKVFSNSKKGIIEYCSEHLVFEKDISANKETFIPYARKPIPESKPCSVCHSVLPPNALFYGVCLSCREE